MNLHNTVSAARRRGGECVHGNAYATNSKMQGKSIWKIAIIFIFKIVLCSYCVSHLKIGYGCMYDFEYFLLLLLNG